MKRLLFSFVLLFNIIAASGDNDGIQDFQFDFIFNQALEQRLKGNTDRAFDLYESAVKLNSESAPAWFEMARIALKQNKKEYSFLLAEEALKRDSTNVDILRFILDISISLNQSSRAIELLNKLLAIDDKMFDSNAILLTRIYTAVGDFDNAMLTIDKLLAKNNEVEHYMNIERCNVYLRCKGPKETEKFIKKLIKSNPDKCIFVQKLGQLYIQQGDTAKAIEQIKRAAFMPDGNDYKLDYYDVVKNSISRSDFENGVIEAFEDDKVDIKIKYNYLLTYSHPSLINQDDNNKLIHKLLDICIRKYPSQEWFYNFASDIYLVFDNDTVKSKEMMYKYFDITAGTSNDWVKLLDLTTFISEEFYRVVDRAFYFFPEDPHIAINYIWGLLRKKEYDKAEKPALYLVEVLKDRKDVNQKYLSIAYECLATIYNNQNRTEDMFRCYEEVIRLDEYNALALNNYAYFLSEENRELDKAENMSRQATTLEPNNPIYLDTYAWVLFKKGLFAESKFVMSLCIQKIATTEHSELDEKSLYYHHYGDILFKSGFTDDALEAWQHAYELEPDNELIKRKIETRSYVE